MLMPPADHVLRSAHPQRIRLDLVTAGGADSSKALALLESDSREAPVAPDMRSPIRLPSGQMHPA